MAVTSVGTGTQTATIDTEHTLDTETTAGVYQLVVDTSNLANGDVVEFNIYTKYASGGTSRLAFPAIYNNVQGSPNKYSPPIPIDTEIIAELKQTAGTGKDFYWNLLKLGANVVSVGSGIQVATINTEHTLDTEVTAGTYVLVVDTANMINGDVVIFKLKTKYASGGTSRLAYSSPPYSNAQGDPNKYSPPVMIDTEIVATLEQTDGSDAVNITAFADAGGGATTVTSANHGLSNGDKVTIAGTTNYNGTHNVSGVSGNDYNIDTAYVADDATGTGTRTVFFPWNLLKVG